MLSRSFLDCESFDSMIRCRVLIMAFVKVLCVWFNILDCDSTKESIRSKLCRKEDEAFLCFWCHLSRWCLWCLLAIPSRLLVLEFVRVEHYCMRITINPIKYKSKCKVQITIVSQCLFELETKKNSQNGRL